MSPLRVEPEGDEALRCTADDPAVALALHRALTAAAAPGVRDWIHAPGSVLVLFDGAETGPDAVARAVLDLDLDQAAAPPRHHVLPIVAGGPDLAFCTTRAGTTPEALIARLAATRFEVAAVGGNGLPLLRATAWDLDVPRLPSPRTAVPAGAIGLAGDRVCVYPVAMPGGWRLIARTTATLVDAFAADPVRCRAGDLVRFRPEPTWTSA